MRDSPEQEHSAVPAARLLLSGCDRGNRRKQLRRRRLSDKAARLSANFRLVYLLRNNESCAGQDLRAALICKESHDGPWLMKHRQARHPERLGHGQSCSIHHSTQHCTALGLLKGNSHISALLRRKLEQDTVC